MPRSLGAEEFAILEEHVRAGDRIAYYAQLDEWGYRYGALAGSVVANDSVPGAIANHYFLNEYVEDTGTIFDVDDLANLSLDLMRQDFAARLASPEVRNGEDLHVDVINAYHSQVFADYGAEADSWTPYIALQQLETPEERQAFWNDMLDAGTIFGNGYSFIRLLQTIGFSDFEYVGDIAAAGISAQGAKSTFYGPFSAEIGNGGYALGGNYQDNSVNGSVGNDVLMGFDGYDTLAGGAGEDRIYGGADDDILVGGSVDEDGNYIDDNSSDTLIGGAGHDTYHITLDWDIAGDFESDFTVWSLSYDDYHANNDAEFTLNTDVINHIDFIGDMDMDGEVVIHTGTAFAPSFSLQTINLRSGQYGFVDWDYEFEVNGYSWAATWVTNGTGRDLVIHDREIQALNGFVVNAYFAIHEADLQSSGFRTHAGSIDAGENGGLAEGDGDNNLITGSVGDDTAIGKGGSDTYLDLGKSGTDVVTDVGSASDVDRVDLTSQSFADTIFARGGAPTVNSQTALIDAASTTYQPGTNDLVITGIAGSSLAGTLIIRDYFGGPETGIEQIALSDRVLSLQDVLAILNTAPTVDEPLVDQTATEGQEWSFTIPATSFSDADGDALTYSATLADGSPLPDWLSFDAATRTFTGTPPQGFDGNLSLSVTAHDGIAGVTDTFELTINDAVNLPTPTYVGTDNADGDVWLTAADDIIDTGAGDEYVNAGGGNDTFLWRKGDGNDAFGAGGDAENTADVVLFADVASTDVTFGTSEGKHITITVNSTGELITLADQLGGFEETFDEVRFSDGVSLSFAELADLAGPAFTYVGTDEADGNVWTTPGDDIITSGGGDDYVNGGDGNDTIYWYKGDGNDSFGAGGNAENTTDVVIFADVASTDVTYGTSEGKHITITVNSTGEVVTLADQVGGFEETFTSIQFADGVVVGFDELVELAGPAFTYVGTDDADGNVWTTADDDIITSGGGDDYVNGGDGNDTFYWYKGDGHDAFGAGGNAENTTDVVIFADVASTDVTYGTSEGKHITITVNSTGEVVTLADQVGGFEETFDSIRFADGVALDFSQFTAAAGYLNTLTSGIDIGDNTTSALSIGSSRLIEGALEQAGDRDWFAIEIQAGESFQFNLTGAPSGAGTLSDPFLYLRDSNGIEVASNDDGGYDLESLIQFTATDAGTYYLDVAAYEDAAGTYKLNITEWDTVA